MYSSSALNSRKTYKYEDELRTRPREGCSGTLEKNDRFSSVSVLKSGILSSDATYPGQNSTSFGCK